MNTTKTIEERMRIVLTERTTMEPGSVNERMAPEFVSCSEDGRECIIRYQLKPEMRNPLGWLHGGVTSTMIDMGMGLLAYFHKQAICPTSSMTVNYLRPNRIGSNLIVRSQVTHLGRHIVHLAAQCWMEDAPEHITATATGSYVVIGAPKDEPLSEKVKTLR